MVFHGWMPLDCADPDDIWRCKFCDAAFWSRRELRDHLERRRLPYQCAVCEQQFHRTAHRMRHEIDMHSFTLTGHRPAGPSNATDFPSSNTSDLRMKIESRKGEI